MRGVLLQRNGCALVLAECARVAAHECSFRAQRLGAYAACAGGGHAPEGARCFQGGGARPEARLLASGARLPAWRCLGVELGSGALGRHGLLPRMLASLLLLCFSSSPRVHHLLSLPDDVSPRRRAAAPRRTAHLSVLPPPDEVRRSAGGGRGETEEAGREGRGKRREEGRGDRGEGEREGLAGVGDKTRSPLIGRVVTEGSGVREQAHVHDMTRGMMHAGEPVGRRRRPVGLGHAELLRVWGGNSGGRRHGRRGQGALGPHRHGSLSLFPPPCLAVSARQHESIRYKSLPAPMPCIRDTPMS